MPEYQPLDYRLRCHSKRTDLPPDVLRDISEAYVRLLNLEEERDEARQEVCSLKSLDRCCVISPKGYAELRKWDCFKEDGK
jgi:hypothetical protein